MKAGTQFLIAARILSTVRGLGAQLTLAARESQLHLYCLGADVVYLEAGRFPQAWFAEQKQDWDPAATLPAKLQNFLLISGSPEQKTAFRAAAVEALTQFFQNEILECRMKQERAVSGQGVFTLSELLMDCGRPFLGAISPDELLGGREIPFKQSPECMARAVNVRITSQEGYLLAKLENQSNASEVVASVPGDEASNKRSILLLWAFGLLDSPVLNQLVPKVEPSREAAHPAAAAPAPGAPKAAPPAAATAAPPAAAPAPPPAPAPAPGESLEELTGLVHQTYQSLSKKDFYTLLDVDAHAKLPEIKTAYYKLARKFHPDRYYGVHDPVLKEKVDIIFSAVNVAYETLKNSHRRMEYDNAPKDRKVIGTTTLNSENTKTVLTKEAISKVAEEHFQKAQRSYEQGNYYQAVQFLRSATQIAPGVAKYWRQLGISLSRNPQWRKEAEDSFQRAVELDPKNPENHLYLGFLYKNSGLKLRAKKHFQTCLQMDPVNEIAMREIRLIDGEPEEKAQGASADKDKKGILGNIFKKK